MFYWLAQYFDFAGFLNLFRYLTFRSGAAVGTAFVIGLIIGPRFINMLRVRQGAAPLFEASLAELQAAWSAPLAAVFHGG
mgnify:CR=1 FL=1